MTGAVRTGAARTATAGRAICAGANASTEEQKASIRIPIDEAIAPYFQKVLCSVAIGRSEGRNFQRTLTSDSSLKSVPAATLKLPLLSPPC